MTRSQGRLTRLLTAATVAVMSSAAAAMLAQPASADELKAGGDMLHGTVKAITGKTIEFAPDYGKGSITIPVEDVESINVERDLYFVHGDDSETTRGKLLGIRDGNFLSAKARRCGRHRDDERS